MVIWSSGGRLEIVTTFWNTGGSSSLSWQSSLTPESKLFARMAASSKNWTMRSRRDETASSDDNSHMLWWPEVMLWLMIVSIFCFTPTFAKSYNSKLQADIMRWYESRRYMIHSLYNFNKSKANHSTLFEFVTMEWGCRLGIIHAHTQKSLLCTRWCMSSFFWQPCIKNLLAVEPRLISGLQKIPDGL